MLDAFDRRDEKGILLYDRLVLSRCFFVGQADCFTVSLILRRWNFKEPFSNDLMTFTRFRKTVAGRYFSYEDKGAPEIVRQVLALPMAEGALPLSCPVLLHAQNSGNRMGYGGPYGASTRYGETTAYVFTDRILKRGDGS